ncbi:MAG: O-acetylhomoserine aminocarboxypropyltransferase/cysteine synthase [Eubacteriales bacterium]|nr:O-acetylhomoserine aminocarboxypropyltransferase/cysteine synthase [Eubacteriales bacterium]
MSDYRIETKCIQSGYEPENGEPRIIPIIQSTTFKYESSDEMGALFDLEKEGYFYSRLANPTCDMVAKKICDLENGYAAMLTASGQAANFYAVFNICEAGDHFISTSAIYGGTFNLFGVTMKKLGIECTFVEPDATEEEIQAAFRPNTKCVFGETLANPALVVLDLEKFADIAHRNGVPFIVDNTFATPINCQAFKWGVDIVTHATTKYMDGHAATIGGCIVDSGNFDWTKYPDKFPGLTTPDESYHGVVYTERFGKGAYITKATAQLMRDLGSVQSPQNAFYINLGLETLPLRVERHCSNALTVAKYLEANEHVAWVNYSDLESSKYHALQQKYMPNGSCGVISFGLKGDKATAVKFMDHLKMIAIVTHVADARTSVLHPASHTHRQMSDEQLKEAGVQPDLIRLSVGIENVNDIIEDIEQAMKQTF